MFELRKVPEIDEQSQLLSRRFQIIDHLCTMFVAELLNSLKLDDDFVEASKVRDVFLLKLLSLVI